MRTTDPELIKILNAVQALAIKLVKENLNIKEESYFEYLNFRENDTECSFEWIKSSLKRNQLSSKYHHKIAPALQRIIQESDHVNGKLIHHERQRELFFASVVSCSTKADEIRSFFENFDQYFIPDNFESAEFVKGLDPDFVYCLNKSFPAFETLTKRDLCFLCLYRRSDLRKKVVQLLDDLSDLPPSQIQEDSATREWRKAKRQFLAISNPRKNEDRSDAENQKIKDKNYEIFIEKFKKLKTFLKAYDSNTLYKKEIIILFLELIWPQDGATNTDFGANDIDALLLFKNHLSEAAQIKLLNEFQSVFNPSRE